MFILLLNGQIIVFIIHNNILYIYYIYYYIVNMNDNFKYYGFYGRRGNTDEINKRASRQKASSDPKLNYKEFGVGTIFSHLKVGNK